MSTSVILQLKQVEKRYANGMKALDNLSLNIHKGEIFALLGPNGAGKTTLINIICGLVNATSGSIIVDGFDHRQQYKAARQRIGLVPQEISTESFENVHNSVSFSRGLFGLKPNPAYIEKLLRNLRLWDKRKEPQRNLSGGMKRRVLIAKALSHEPSILFLDEPTAGVDVSLRQEMWAQIQTLREQGITIILTTHYLEEAEQMADRIGIIQQGKLLHVEAKTDLMQKFGEKALRVRLRYPLTTLPISLQQLGFILDADGLGASYTHTHETIDMAPILRSLAELGDNLSDIESYRSSLEDIFVRLTKEKNA